MKTYFTKLFNYDHHANKLIFDVMNAAGNPEKTVQLMAHLLGSQQVWLNRVKKQPAAGGAIWPDWKAAQFPQLIEHNHHEWIAFVESLNDDDFNGVIPYKDSKGNPFENQLLDILAHVINHGTHHRAQIGRHLKFAGVEKLPLTDYIFYLRNL